MKWLEGKKTWIGALLLIAAGVAGFLWGPLDLTTAGIVIGAGFSVIGLGDKLQRFLPLLLEVLRAMKQEARRGEGAPPRSE